MTYQAALSRFQRTPFSRKICAVGFGGVLIIAGACTDDFGASPPTTRPSRTQLEFSTSGSARLGIQSNGSFDLARTPSKDTVSAEGAAQLANAYSQQLLPFLLTYLEKTRGGKIDRKRLRSCGRPLYAESVFEALDADLPIGVRQGYGPYWLVTLCAGQEPQVSLAVSALATGTTVKDGKITIPFEYGGEFFAFGIPKGHVGEFPMSPEQGAIIVAEATGARVIEVPRLVMPMNTEGMPQNAKWEVKLDRAVNFLGAKRGHFQRSATAVGVILDGKGSERIGQFGPS